jgi:uncharacterized membrane protein YuzA (DUF378 family)
MRSKALDWTALTFVVVGALNWALVGLFRLDFIAALFGGFDSWLSRVVYVLIGIAGLYCLSLYGRLRWSDTHIPLNRE